uniref:SET domain-containing protein n=1 Tax=Timema douglasi TaxID=61478 RepID=A0A7R8VPV4_TIMDO|nr:unnamed protein product [Timema douglasi]
MHLGMKYYRFVRVIVVLHFGLFKDRNPWPDAVCSLVVIFRVNQNVVDIGGGELESDSWSTAEKILCERYFVGRSIVVRATRPLASGDIVAENYGPVFTKRSLDSRQRALTSRYWFRCICQACKENWPALGMVDNNDFRLWSYFTSVIEGFPLIFLPDSVRTTFSTSGFGSRATSLTTLD